MSSQFIRRNISFLFQQVRYNSNRTCIAKIGREKYTRMYLTTVVNPDGSSYTIRHYEPTKIIKLPFDESIATAEEIEKHKNRNRIVEKLVQDEILEDEGFSLDSYSHLWKSKPKDNN